MGQENLPKTIEEFNNLKYNNSEKWNDTKRAYRYINKHPDSEYKHYKIYSELKDSGVKAGTPMSPKKIRAYILEDTGSKEPYHIMNRMLERNITSDAIQNNVDNAKVMFSQWDGKRRAYYSSD